MGLAAVSPVRGAFAASIRRGGSWVRGRIGDGGAIHPADCVCTGGKRYDCGDAISLSPAVDAERLLDDDGNCGVEKVVDAAETKDS